MVVEVVATDALAMSVCIVSPAEYASVRDIMREEIAEPVDAVGRCPSLVGVAI